jgi:hypothetical protein
MSTGGDSRPKPTSPRDVDDFAIFSRFARWFVLRLVRLAVSRWYGFLAIAFIGLGFAIAGTAGLFLIAAPGRRLGRIILYLFFAAWLCVGLLLGLVRHAVRRQPPEWRELNATGRFDRIVITIFGTVILGLPIAWLAWTIMAPG